MNLGQSCEECVETEQVTRWHAEVLWREYPIACEPRLKWSCQSDLRYAASSILKKIGRRPSVMKKTTKTSR